MLVAVYVDLAGSRSIVGIQPKPPFYPLFESLRQKPESEEKLTGPGVSLKPDFGMVETGESRTPRPREAAQNILQA